MQKNIQGSYEYKAIHIPTLVNPDMCLVQATKHMILQLKLKPGDPLFLIRTFAGKTILTAP